MSAFDYFIYRVGRRISRTKAFGVVIPTPIRRFLQGHLQRNAMELMPDRVHMTQVLLPTLQALMPELIIDVGVESYSAHYRTFFDTGKYWTIDKNPSVAACCPDGMHISGDVANIGSYFPAGSVDVILLNGVIGFGVNSLAEEEAVVAECFKVLREGGWLMIGWDRDSCGRPMIFGEAAIPAIDPLKLPLLTEKFAHQGPLELDPRTTFKESAHVYDWFKRLS